MRKFDLLQQLDVGAACPRHSRRHPLADAVHRQDRRFVEGRAQEGAGGVRQVMFGEQNAFLGYADFRLQRAGNPELVQHPGDHRFAEHLPRFRVGLQDGGQDAVQFAERLLEEHDVVEIFPVDAGGIQAVLDGIFGKVVVVFLAA